MKRKVIKTPKAPPAVGPYSQAIEVGQTLYISGQIPIDPATGKMVEGGIKEQTIQVLKNIEIILSAAGYRKKDVVKSTCLLTDMNNFKAMNEIYAGFYDEEPPARSAMGVVSLPLDSMIEIETVAVKK